MTVELRFICKVRTAADSREVFYIVLFCFIFLFFFASILAVQVTTLML